MRRRRFPWFLNAFTKRTFRIGWPMLLSQAAAMLLANIDMAMVGRISTDALAAVGVAGTFMNLLMIVAWSSSFGFTIAIAMELGKPKGGDAGKLTYHSLVLGQVLGVLLAALAFVSSGPVYRGMGLEPELLEMATRYSQVFSLAFLSITGSAMVGSCLSAYMRTKHIFAGSLIVLVVNTVLDYVLIFGKWGAPELGVSGAAWASVIAVLVQWIYLLGAIWFNRAPFGPIPQIRPSGLLQTMRRVAPYSVSAMLEWSIWFGGIFILTMMITPFGSITLAVFHVSLKLQQLFLLGMHMTTSTSKAMIGRAFGNGKQPHRIVRWHDHSMVMGWIAVLPGVLLIVVIPVPIFAIFMDRQDLLSIGSPYAPYFIGALIAATIIVRFINTTLGSTLRSMGVAKYFIYSTSIMQVFMLALAYWLIVMLNLGIWGAMIASFADEAIRNGINFYVIRRKFKTHTQEVFARRHEPTAA